MYVCFTKPQIMTPPMEDRDKTGWGTSVQRTLRSEFCRTTLATVMELHLGQLRTAYLLMLSFWNKIGSTYRTDMINAAHLSSKRYKKWTSLNWKCSPIRVFPKWLPLVFFTKSKRLQDRPFLHHTNVSIEDIDKTICDICICLWSSPGVYGLNRSCKYITNIW